MLLRSTHLHAPRRGVILMVVLAMLTLFAVVGLAFVAYSESEVSQVQNQKESEAIKYPDADMMFNYGMRQMIYPTNDQSSALYSHSLLEDIYGRNNFSNVAFNGSGLRNFLHRSPQDPNFIAGTHDPARVGQDEYYQPNSQNSAFPYVETRNGSRNAPWTYPDHTHTYLGAVSANYTETNGTQHGPTALARSFARHIRVSLMIFDNTLPPAADVISYPTITFDPYGDPNFYDFWTRRPFPPPAPLVGIVQADWYYHLIQLPPLTQPEQFYRSSSVVFVPPGSDKGGPAFIVMDPRTWQRFSMRPTPGLNPNFPPPGDGGADVKNLPPEVKTLVGYNGTTPVFGNNDSIWMDLGFPASSAPNGRKMKPLFAFTVIDLDGRVNLNAAGNLRGRVDNTGNNNTFHTSGVGLAPYDINPTKTGLTANDLQQMWSGMPNPPASHIERGRAGYDNTGDPQTTSAGYRPLLRQAPYYSRYNLDGTFDNLGVPANYFLTAPNYLIPGNTGTNYIDRFQSNNLRVNGYENGQIDEWTRNAAARSPLFLTPFSPNVPLTNLADAKRSFSPANTEALLRLRDAGADQLDSDLRRLISTNLANNSSARWRLTTVGSDLNVQGFAPWYNGGGAYQLNQNTAGISINNDGYSIPTQPPVSATPKFLRPAGPQVALPVNAPAAAGGDTEFRGNNLWQSVLGGVTRLDLARQLPDYPRAAGPNTPIDVTVLRLQTAVASAIRARQNLAELIYRRLKQVTRPGDISISDGALDSGDPTQLPLINARRWLAQLAVNIVDYIDNDDYITPFHWRTGASMPAAADWVYGTELPRVVLNEVYVEAVNGSVNAGRADGPYNVRHWVELYNPLSTPAATDTYDAWNESTLARLHIGGAAGYSAYRLIVTRNDGQLLTIRDVDTTLVATAPTAPNTNTVNFPPDSVIAPSDTNLGDGTNLPANVGLYMVGPGMAPLGAGATFPAPHHSDPQMEVAGRIPQVSGPFLQVPANPGDDDNRQAILLQRLACPYLPPDNNPASPFYNPYVTVDYVNELIAQRAVGVDTNGAPDQVPVEQRKAFGKMQPYAGWIDLWREQNPDTIDTTPAVMDNYTDQPQHTFLRHNRIERGTIAIPAPTADPYSTTPTAPVVAEPTLKLPFEWLVHLDRAPHSPMELFHVNGYKPHELTQQFNRLTTVITNRNTTMAPVNYPANTPVVLTPDTTSAYAQFYGSHHGYPWASRQNDLVRVKFGAAASVWLRVQVVGANNSTITITPATAQTVNAGESIRVECIVPFAHYAPWFRSGQTAINPAFASMNRIYRFLETVAVRNPGIGIGQIRFTATRPQNPPVPAFDVPLPDGSVWVTFDNGPNDISLAQLPQLGPNDSVIDIIPAIPDAMSGDINAGDILVFRAGQSIPNPPGPNISIEERVRVLEVDKRNNRIRTVFLNATPEVNPPSGEVATFDLTYHGGRQPGKMNINNIWDLDSFQALADAQTVNSFYGPAGDRDLYVRQAYWRMLQQRQPGYFSANPAGVEYGRPFHGMGTGDAPGTGIQHTLLSDQFGNIPAITDQLASLRSTFEVGIPGQDHPYQRFELLTKVFNNTTTRSNAFAIWLTVGFFDYDESSGSLGAEINQLDGRNIRYRFFAIVDRSTMEAWLRVTPNSNMSTLVSVPSLDPRYDTVARAAVSFQGSYARVPGSSADPSLPGVWAIDLPPSMPASLFNYGQLIEITSQGPTLLSEAQRTERAVVLNPTLGMDQNSLPPALPPIPPGVERLYVRLSKPHFDTPQAGMLTIRALPIPRMIQHWTRIN